MTMPPFDREDTTISDVLERIVDALERADPNDPTLFYGGGRGTDHPFRADYGFAVRRGLGSDDVRAGRRENRLVDTRWGDGGLSVVADLPGVDSDDVTVRIDDDRRLLEIGTDEGTVERIPLPWPVAVRTERFNNGVLDVVLEVIHDGDE